MLARSLKVGAGVLGLALTCWYWMGGASGQDAQPPGEAPPPVPQGIEVQARGPIHEAFASLAGDPTPTKPVPKQPPKPLDEMPPEEKPEGNAVWIGGYWGWDDDRSDFLWVTGTWRTPPPGKKWVAGYWRDNTDSWQWVPGFWTQADTAEKPAEQVTYFPAPPPPPEVASPGPPPNPETFFVPGSHVWVDGRYMWRAGYWARVQPGYVWVSSHYRWTPTGYVYIPGYWDLAVSRRGFLYAPIVVDPNVVTVGFVYTPAYVVPDRMVVECLFVRPSHCHYYFGDYYGPAYRDYGFESCVVYSRRHYDSIIVYETYERRSDPTWINVQITLCNDRYAGRAPCPPRTLVVRDRVVVNNTFLVTPRQLAAARGSRIEVVDAHTRLAAREHAVVVREVGVQRHQAERAPMTAQPRPAAFRVPEVKAVSHVTTVPAHQAVTHQPGSTGAPVGQHPGTVPGHVPPGQLPPGHAPPSRPVPPGHAPPPKDKDKDKDKRP
jgi:WXXGXW repeat (2 copies)